jgi:hypothetical protein
MTRPVALNEIGLRPALPRVIAVDLDDTLNNFTEVLQGADFTPEPSPALSPETYSAFLAKIRADHREDDPLLSTPYSFLRYKIHEQCYRLARAREDGVAFMRWLKAEGWTVVICTRRDLRRAEAVTRAWLSANEIPFDYLFMVLNKIVFCKAWRIGHLVDDDVFNVTHSGDYALKLYFPLMAKHAGHDQSEHVRGFRHFGEVQKWIHASAC